MKAQAGTKPRVKSLTLFGPEGTPTVFNVSGEEGVTTELPKGFTKESPAKLETLRGATGRSEQALELSRKRFKLAMDKESTRLEAAAETRRLKAEETGRKVAKGVKTEKRAEEAAGRSKQILTIQQAREKRQIKEGKVKTETREVNKAILSQELRTSLATPNITKDDAIENIKAYNKVSTSEIVYWGEQDAPWWKGKQIKPIFTRIDRKFGTPKEIQK